ncbi:MAG: glutamate mutase L, partial [Desulfobacterales bacterium]
FPESHHEAKAADIVESCEIVKQVFKSYYHGDIPDVWVDPRLIERKNELKRAVMYNAFHLALIGSYEGQVTLDNFFDYAISVEAAQNREIAAEREKNYESMMLDFINEDNYPTGQCGMISADTLDLGLQTGLLQAPQITVIDKRYEMTGKCRTKIVNGTCRIDEVNGQKVIDEIDRVNRVREKAPWYFLKDVSMADDASFITEVAEDMQSVVDDFRKQVAITAFDNIKVLMVDFGSTFTKVGILDTSSDEFSLNYVPTTPDDIRAGLADGLGVGAACKAAGDWKPLDLKMEEFDIKLPCSSAKGGLKMVTVALVKEESGFAAELASLTAGAKLINSYDSMLTAEQARAIYEVDQPEIILLAGGVDDGGDTATQLHNARMLAENARFALYARYGVPVIYAGNQDIGAEISSIFKEKEVDIYMTENVMPDVNTFHIEAVNETIREIFQTIIIRGKGFDVVEKYMSAPFLPTPRAAFLGINLLAKGYSLESGIGNIMALDIGGCTTDFYANVHENPLYLFPGRDPLRKVKRTILKTPNAPLAYRRVEGKYGLSYNAENLMELERFRSGELNSDLNVFFQRQFPEFSPGQDPFKQFAYQDNGAWRIDLKRMFQWIHQNPHAMPRETEWVSVYSFLAKEIMAVATGNNVGYVDETDTYFLQYGVNFFTKQCTTLLIGGTIYHKCKEGLEYHRDDLKLIASGAVHNAKNETMLRPNGQVMLDADYLIAIVGGLYGRLDPERALRMIKKHIKPLELV